MLTKSKKLPTATVMLSETVLTSDVSDSSADCCCLTNVDPDDAGDSAPPAVVVVVDAVVVVDVVVVGDDVVTPGVLDGVNAGCRLVVVVSRSLRAVWRVPSASNDVTLSQSSSW